MGQAMAAPVEALLGQAALVATSDLTFVECERGLRRLVAAGAVTPVEVQARRNRLYTAASSWTQLGMNADVLDRAKEDFPVEPIRALDALHLASAVVFRRLVPDLGLLTLDRRIRENGPHLGFDVWPS